ncbi:globin domain-containing protein [Nocardia asteroides]|uniref:globin domain-containing protein n=1 Tax=Nocardia asteroides TaxID=1824 RepID=UPI0037C720F7
MNIELLQSSWKTVERMGPDAIDYFYAHLFHFNPDLRSMFAEDMTSQRDRLFAGLGRVIGQVDSLRSDPSFVAELGRRHCGYGVTAAHYPLVAVSLIATVEHCFDCYGQVFTTEHRQTWSEALRTVAQIMVASAATVSGQVAAAS